MITIRPDAAIGIAAVSPICGCSGKCAYCYLDIKDLKHPQINALSVDDAISDLLQNDQFLQGREGTFICVGVWGEIFPRDSDLREESFRWIRQLAKLENPIVLITKGALTEQEAFQLKSMQIYEHQIVVLVSVSTLSFWKSIEPGTASPASRFQTISNLKNQDIESCVFLNPFINGITNLEYRQILEETRQRGIKHIILSPLYLNDILCEKLQKHPIMRPVIEKYKHQDANASYMKNQDFEVKEDTITVDHQELLREAEHFGISCWFHYSCFLCNYYQRKNIYFYQRADICMDCGNCVKLQNR